MKETPTSGDVPRRIVAALVLLLLPVMIHGEDFVERLYLDAPQLLDDSSATRCVNAGDGTLQSLMAEARLSLESVKDGPGFNRSWWGLVVKPADGGNDSIEVSLRFGNKDYGDFLDGKIARVTVTRNGRELCSKDFENTFVEKRGSYNSLGIRVTSGGRLTVYGGGHGVKQLAEASVGDLFIPGSVAVKCEGKGLLSQFVTEVSRAPESLLATRYDVSDIDAALSSSRDAVEGYWTYFDRENDPAYARLGGRYTLAVIRNDDEPGTYDIVYAGGAETMGDRWKPMMLKGKLKATVFEGHYDLEWIDSTFSRITGDMHASIDNGALLTLSFPMLKTVIRFSKMPANVWQDRRRDIAE